MLDGYTKMLLTVIAAALVIFAFQLIDKPASAQIGG